MIILSDSNAHYEYKIISHARLSSVWNPIRLEVLGDGGRVPDARIGRI